MQTAQEGSRGARCLVRPPERRVLRFLPASWRMLHLARSLHFTWNCHRAGSGAASERHSRLSPYRTHVMNTKCIAIFAALGLLSASPSGASPRVWKDSTSGRTLTAEFVELTKEAVKVRRSDGKIIAIPLSRLTPEDITFARTAAASAGAAANDWPSWRGPKRDGHSPDKGLLRKWPADGPKLVWTFKDCGRGYSSPSVVDRPRLSVLMPEAARRNGPPPSEAIPRRATIPAGAQERGAPPPSMTDWYTRSTPTGTCCA